MTRVIGPNGRALRPIDPPPWRRVLITGALLIALTAVGAFAAGFASRAAQPSAGCTPPTCLIATPRTTP